MTIKAELHALRTPGGPPQSRRRHRGEDGASAVELVMYMPLLMIAILLAVQFCLIYLGNEVASAAAREGSRVARVTGDQHTAQLKAVSWVQQIGKGALDSPVVTVTQQGEDIRVTVSGRAKQLLPWVKYPRVEETVVGPIEEFKPDTGAGAAP